MQARGNQIVIKVKEAHDKQKSVNFIEAFLDFIKQKHFDMPVHFLLERDKERLDVLAQEAQLGGVSLQGNVESLQSVADMQFAQSAIDKIGRTKLEEIYSYALRSDVNGKGWLENRKGLLRILGNPKVKALPIDASWELILKCAREVAKQGTTTTDLEEYQKQASMLDNLEELIDAFDRTKDPKIKHQIASHTLLMPYRDKFIVSRSQSILREAGGGIFFILTGAEHSHALQKGIPRAYTFDRTHDNALSKKEEEELRKCIAQVKDYNKSTERKQESKFVFKDLDSHALVRTRNNTARMQDSVAVSSPRHSNYIASTTMNNDRSPILDFIFDNAIPIILGVGATVIGIFGSRTFRSNERKSNDGHSR